MNYLIIKHNEITLKGKNKNYFERILARNIRDCLKKNIIKYNGIKKIYNRFIIEGSDYKCLKNVFGISYICKSIKTELDIKEIEKQAIKLANNIDSEKTFKINTKRANKDFSYGSLDLNKKIGASVSRKTNAKVDLSNPDLEIFIEILDNAYLYTKRIKGFGGLPIGSEGLVLSLIEDKNSILASLLMMKRGCSIIPVYFKNKDTSLLDKYAFGKLNSIKIKNLNEIDKIAKQRKAKAAVVNQTLDNFKDLAIKTPVLRPLISFSDKQIKEAIKF